LCSPPTIRFAKRLGRLADRFSDTYMEISPSGKGLKFWLRGRAADLLILYERLFPPGSPEPFLKKRNVVWQGTGRKNGLVADLPLLQSADNDSYRAKSDVPSRRPRSGWRSLQSCLGPKITIDVEKDIRGVAHVDIDVAAHPRRDNRRIGHRLSRGRVRSGNCWKRLSSGPNR
jgi:hypothetical protein